MSASADGVPSSWPPHFQNSVDKAWRDGHDAAVGYDSYDGHDAAVGYDSYESSLPFYPLWAPPPALASGDPQVMDAPLDEAGNGCVIARGPSTAAESELPCSFSTAACPAKSGRRTKLHPDAVYFLQVGSTALLLRDNGLS